MTDWFKSACNETKGYLDKKAMLDNMDPVQKGMYLEDLRKERALLKTTPLNQAEIAVDEAWERNVY